MRKGRAARASTRKTNAAGVPPGRRTFLQYHNATRLGWVPLDERPFLQTQLAICTRRRILHAAVGATVLLIVGLGKPKRYYLWECFRIEGVAPTAVGFSAWGSGWQLVPPQRLDGCAFEQFRRACAWFIGLRAIDQLPYHRTLIDLAVRFRRAEVDTATEHFCSELIDALPASGDPWFFRACVRLRLNDRSGAHHDLGRAIAAGGEFAERARNLLATLSIAP